jgi:hypothetical protein
MSDRKQPRCPYCLGVGKLPKGLNVLNAAHTPPQQWQTCMGCSGTGRLQADDWREWGGAAELKAPVGMNRGH